MIHIVGRNGTGYDVLMTEEQLASFQQAVAAATRAGLQTTLDDLVEHELKKVLDQVGHEIDEILTDELNETAQ